jgi:hypothetical protein
MAMSSRIGRPMTKPTANAAMTLANAYLIMNHTMLAKVMLMSVTVTCWLFIIVSFSGFPS